MCCLRITFSTASCACLGKTKQFQFIDCYEIYVMEALTYNQTEHRTQPGFWWVHQEAMSFMRSHTLGRGHPGLPRRPLRTGVSFIFRFHLNRPQSGRLPWNHRAMLNSVSCMHLMLSALDLQCPGEMWNSVGVAISFCLCFTLFFILNGEEAVHTAVAFLLFICESGAIESGRGGGTWEKAQAGFDLRPVGARL